MTYSVRIERSAARELARIRRPDRARLVAAVDALAESPPTGTALEGQPTGLRRTRGGDYRVVYEVRARRLVVLASHRRDVYRTR